MKLIIESVSENESFARTVVAAYITRLDPTLEELADVKTAVSEAVTNSIIHGYNGKSGEIEITCEIQEREVIVRVTDTGIGITDIKGNGASLYNKTEWERSGMGFAFMEAFMDSLEVTSEPGKGTSVLMRKHIGKEQDS